MSTLADGQLASSATSILAGSSLSSAGDVVDLVCTNSGSQSEAVVITFKRSGGTARELPHATLAADESVVYQGIRLGYGDTLLGQTTNASAVDYVVFGKSAGPFRVYVTNSTGAEKKSETVSTATNLTVSGAFERAAGSMDDTLQNRVRLQEDFLDDAGATLPTLWGTQDTSAAGSPTLNYVADALNGEYNLAHDTQSEAQTLTLYWADQLMIDPTKNPVFEARIKINFAGAAFTADQRIVIGLAAARNATLDSNATHAWFRIEGANLNILWETDDATTDDDDNDSGIDIVDNTWTVFRIDMSDLDNIKFYVDGVLAAGTAAGAFTAAHKLQPYIEIQRDAGAEAESVHVDYVVCEWDRT